MALVECPACKGMVSTEAASCPHCGHPLRGTSDTPPSQRAGCGSMVLKVIGVVAVLFLLMLGCAVISQLGRTRHYTTSAPTPASGPVLRVGKWHWSEDYGYVTAEGTVTNISSESLANVQAVVTFKTKDGTLVTSEDAVIDYNPLLPGQTSPWKVMARANPAMTSASVEFKEMFGGTLTTTQ